MSRSAVSVAGYQSARLGRALVDSCATYAKLLRNLVLTMKAAAKEFNMRSPIPIAILLFIGCMAVAPCCAQASFSHALIQASCAPWDGPAIDIRLTPEPGECKNVTGPYIDMGVWRGLPIHAGQVVKFGSGSNEGFSSRCTKVGDCERAESGTIMFDSYQDGSGATGRYQLHFKSGEVSGSFDAKWCENHIVCR